MALEFARQIPWYKIAKKTKAMLSLTKGPWIKNVPSIELDKAAKIIVKHIIFLFKNPLLEINKYRVGKIAVIGYLVP